MGVFHCIPNNHLNLDLEHEVREFSAREIWGLTFPVVAMASWFTHGRFGRLSSKIEEFVEVIVVWHIIRGLAVLLPFETCVIV